MDQSVFYEASLIFYYGSVEKSNLLII